MSRCEAYKVVWINKDTKEMFLERPERIQNKGAYKNRIFTTTIQCTKKAHEDKDHENEETKWRDH